MQRAILRLGLLLTPLFLLADADIARADYGDRLYWQSQSGQTNFSDPIAIACYGQGRVPIGYTTAYEGTTYSGTFWITSVSNCSEDIRSLRISGDFEDRNASGSQRCAGQLTLSFNLPNGLRPTDPPTGDGTALWENVQAVQGYSCSGAGANIPPLPISPTYSR